MLLSLLAVPAHAAELKQKTVEAFGRYIRATEARMAEESRDANAFLWVDHLPEPRRQTVYAQLGEGRIYLEHLNTREEGKPIEIPSGLIHHWVGVAFIPGVTLQQTLAVVQDYDNHQNIYKPDVQRSKLVHRDGDTFQVYMRLHKKTIVTVVLDAEYDVRYFTDDATRVRSRSYSTRIAEVEAPGEPDEREKPVGKDHGYLWRLYSYWRFQEKDGGVYVQLESIALSRSVPAIFAWLVNPLLRSIPREALANLLSATRSAVTKRRAAATDRPASGEPNGMNSTLRLRAVALFRKGLRPPAFTTSIVFAGSLLTGFTLFEYHWQARPAGNAKDTSPLAVTWVVAPNPNRGNGRSHPVALFNQTVRRALAFAR